MKKKTDNIHNYVIIQRIVYFMFLRISSLPFYFLIAMQLR